MMDKCDDNLKELNVFWDLEPETMLNGCDYIINSESHAQTLTLTRQLAFPNRMSIGAKKGKTVEVVSAWWPTRLYTCLDCSCKKILITILFATFILLVFWGYTKEKEINRRLRKKFGWPGD